MKTIGIICEYNPFHNGHQKQIEELRNRFGQDTRVVALMSGNFVQRGEPALYPRELRAEAALLGGANLVLELPVTCSLRSAEGFASGGVSILSGLGICDGISYGCEDPLEIESLAEAALTPAYEEALREELSLGKPYAAAAERALTRLGCEGALIKKPNNILALEYVKAIRKSGSQLELYPVQRNGSFHGSLSRQEPSAEQLRSMENFSGFIPPETAYLYETAVRYNTAAGERALLAVLRALPESRYETLPYSSEGLWNKIRFALERGDNLAEVVEYAKSRRYPYTRISRMLLCAYLGISDSLLRAEPPYIRVLGCRKNSTRLLKQAREGSIRILQPGEKAEPSEYADLERRSALLYALFSAGSLTPGYGAGHPKLLITGGEDEKNNFIFQK